MESSKSSFLGQTSLACGCSSQCLFLPARRFERELTLFVDFVGSKFLLPIRQRATAQYLTMVNAKIKCTGPKKKKKKHREFSIYQTLTAFLAIFAVVCLICLFAPCSLEPRFGVRVSSPVCHSG